MTKTILYGGTFNPIHKGHIALCLWARQQLDAQRVILMPTACPPHKKPVQLESDADRLALCGIAARKHPFIEVSDFEIRRGGFSYTVDTVRHLRESCPEDTLYLLMGSDMFLTFRQWRQWREIARQAVLVVGARENGEREALQAMQASLAAEGIQALVLDNPTVEMSSTEIREEIRTLGISDKLEPEVQQYILDKGLYPPDWDDAYLRSLRAFIRPKMDPKRFLHSLCVERRAVRLARIWGAEPYKAAVAGILHDVCKRMDPEVLLQMINVSGIINGIHFESQPKLLHSYAGALYVQRELGIQDTDIINAIRYHTTGRAGMSLLEEIIYMADLTSAERDYPDAPEVRVLAETDLKKAMAFAMVYITGELKKKGRWICPDTVAAYRQYCVKNGGKA